MKLYQHYSVYGFSNSYILGNETTMEALIIDPAELTPTMIEKIELNGLRLTGVLITHAHQHHIKGLLTILKIYEPVVYASNSRILEHACRKVRDDEIFEEAGFRIRALAVPGHSQDSIAYLVNDSMLFTGDILHAGLAGRTNSLFNARSLVERIRQKLFTLPDDVLVFPGHGPPSTLGTEKVANLSFDSRFSSHLQSEYDFFL